jgi:hypothetical protein
MKNVNTQNRPLHIIADEICEDWKDVNYGAKPYLEAMSTMNKITDTYGQDSAQSVVCYFLSNASTWKGEVAKRIKIELNQLIKY